MNNESIDKEDTIVMLRSRISLLEEENANLRENNAMLARAVLDLQETVCRDGKGF